MITHPIYAAVTAATVVMPASTDGVHAVDRQLIGIALFIAERHRKRWRFARRAHAIPAGEPESALLEWAAVRLPGDAMLIGWNVDHGVVPAMLEAAATAPPTVAHRLLGRLLRLLSGGVVDMPLPHGGGGAPALATVAADMAIYAPTWDVDAVMGA